MSHVLKLHSCGIQLPFDPHHVMSEILFWKTGLTYEPKIPLLTLSRLQGQITHYLNPCLLQGPPFIALFSSGLL